MHKMLLLRLNSWSTLAPLAVDSLDKSKATISNKPSTDTSIQMRQRLATTVKIKTTVLVAKTNANVKINAMIATTSALIIVMSNNHAKIVTTKAKIKKTKTISYSASQKMIVAIVKMAIKIKMATAIKMLCHVVNATKTVRNDLSVNVIKMCLTNNLNKLTSRSMFRLLSKAQRKLYRRQC